MAVVDLLADNNFGDTRSGGLAGPMGLFVIVVLAIVTVLLIRNMSMRIRRLPERFPGQEDPAPGGPGPATGHGSGSADGDVAARAGGGARRSSTRAS